MNKLNNWLQQQEKNKKSDMVQFKNDLKNIKKINHYSCGLCDYDCKACNNL